MKLYFAGHGDIVVDIRKATAALLVVGYTALGMKILHNRLKGKISMGYQNPPRH